MIVSLVTRVTFNRFLSHYSWKDDNKSPEDLTTPVMVIGIVKLLLLYLIIWRIP